MSKEAYVKIETAKLLKEKGFGWKCNRYYDGEDYFVTAMPDNWNDDTVLVSIPTHQMALAWLREKNFLLWVYPVICIDVKSNRNFHWMWDGKKQRHDALHFGDKRSYNTYEDAVEAALKYSLENLI